MIYPGPPQVANIQLDQLGMFMFFSPSKKAGKIADKKYCVLLLVGGHPVVSDPGRKENPFEGSESNTEGNGRH